MKDFSLLSILEGQTYPWALPLGQKPNYLLCFLALFVLSFFLFYYMFPFDCA